MNTTHPARGYIAAALIVAAAAAVRAAIGPLGVHIPFVSFYPAVLVAGIYGGIRAGLLATGLAAFSATFWMEPAGTPWVASRTDLLLLAFFVVICSVLSYVSERIYRAFSRAITERKRMEEALERRLVALTRPLDSTEELVFEDLFSIEEIQSLQDKFAKACGVASIITRADGTPITKPSNFCRLCKDIIRNTAKGRENCHCSDSVIGRYSPSGPVIQPCLSGGLWDAGASISVGGTHIANWLVGQVRNNTQTESKMRLYAGQIGADEDELIAAFREVPSMPLEQFKMVAQALFTLAGQLSSMAYQNVQQARFITERKLMEQELRKAHDSLELRVQERTAELNHVNKVLSEQAALLDLAHDAILIRDKDDLVVSWNNGASETYGFTKEETIGKLTHELLHTKFPEPLEQIREHVNQKGRWEGELRHTTAAGEEIVVESRWAFKADVDSKPWGTLEINRDITDRKKAEEALKANLARLELINEELQEFAFVASHDLQEPLRKIQTFGNMLKSNCAAALDSAGTGYLDRVLDSAGRMRQLLDDLLQYSRVAARPEPFEKVDLRKIVEEAVNTYRSFISNSGAEVEIGDLPSLEVDESQMLRLFQNLIGNALKFRSDSSPAIKVRAKYNGRESCEIVVIDNGIGFEQRYAERIFKPFQRLHGRSEYEGTGIGLAICRKIAERHGGTIRAESRPGEGSTFIIVLPLGGDAGKRLPGSPENFAENRTA
ncbi:MAG: PocR ligand-binding domain-containing protein [Syntrophobacteraceae bacterium]